MEALFVITIAGLFFVVFFPIVFPIAFGIYLAIKRRTPSQSEIIFFIVVECAAFAGMVWASNLRIGTP